MVDAAVGFVAGLPTWVQVVVILSSSFVAAKGIELLGSVLIHRSDRLTTGGLDRVILEVLHLPLYATVFLMGVYASAQLLGGSTAASLLANAAVSVMVLVWAYATVRLSGHLITGTIDSPAGHELAPVIKNVLSFFVVLGTFFVLLSVWEVNVTPLLASAGVIGIVLGIAAQDSIGNFFGGLSLYLDRTYKIGDVLQLESGERGSVLDMSIRSTTILTRDNIAITVPNSQMNSTQVINESAPVRRRRVRLDVGVAYGSDLETVKAELLGAAADVGVVLDSPTPVVRYREFADSAIVAQLQCYIDHPALRGRARHLLIEAIDERFATEGIKIPFPQREVTFFEAGNEVRVAGGNDRGDATVESDLSVDALDGIEGTPDGRVDGDE